MVAGFVKEKQHRYGVLGEEREPEVVGSGDRAPQRVFVDVAHLEVLEEPSSPALSCRHVTSFPVSCAGVPNIAPKSGEPGRVRVLESSS
jgi:hypothetical protein